MNRSQEIKNRLKNGYHFQHFYVRLPFIIIDFIGNLLIRPFIKRTLTRFPCPRKILLCKNDHFGDLVLFLKVLPKIRELFKDDELHLVIGSWSKNLLENNPYIDKVIYYDNFFLNRDKNIFKRLLADISTSFDFILESLKNKYDIAIDFRSYFPNMVPLLFFGNVSYKVGFTTAGFGFLLNHSKKWKENVPETEHFLDLIRVFGEVAYRNSTQAIEYLANNDKSERLLHNFRVNMDRKIVLVHPFGGHITKNWRIDNWKKIIKELVNGKYIVLIIGQSQSNPFVDVVDNQNIFNAINKTDFHTLASLIKKAEFLIGMDSFPAQLSVALNKRSIILMTGVENQISWYQSEDNVLIIRNEVPCSPCYKKLGCNKMTCLDIDPEDVINKVKAFIL